MALARRHSQFLKGGLLPSLLPMARENWHVSINCRDQQGVQETEFGLSCRTAAGKWKARTRWLIHQPLASPKQLS